MVEKEIRSWKKVFESDLSYISYELKDLVEKPALIVLEGPVGAGKTTFTKNFIEEETNSPTYSIINEIKDIVHADFYRIKDREEIIHLEIPLYIEGKNYFLVEWGKKHIQSLLKEITDDFTIYLLELSINEHENDEGEQSRNFTLFSLKEG